MFRQSPSRQLIKYKEALIRASGLFSEPHYRAQLKGWSLAPRNLIRHYLLRGQQIGLSPAPLFDNDWYGLQYPDVAAAVQDFFFHYVEHGQREYRSPHPLFDPIYYQRQSSERIDRPLTHFLASEGRSGLDPHPLFDVRRFLKRYDAVLPENENPLIYFLSHKECETTVADVFQGHYYASKINQPYSWPRHGVVEFLKRVQQERVSAHPDINLNFYLTANHTVRLPEQNDVAHSTIPDSKEGNDQELLTFPLRGKKLDQEFEGEYLVMVRPIPTAEALPPNPLTTLPRQPTASLISTRRANTQRNLNGRLRLDQPAPSRSLGRELPIISILMPVYRPPLIFLDRAIRSVLQQTSGNWELCIVDDCSGDVASYERLKGYAKSDRRIKVGVASQNGGISRASNAALDLATGAYVALLDNDDMLTIDAVQTITEALIEEPDLDLLYSDEALIDENDLIVHLFSKPDWSPTLLFACMYIGHLTTYRKALIEELGRFRPEFDFSQDYDLALRVRDAAPRVRHIRAYLYGWRMIAGSAAQGGKPYARLTNVAALQDALNRRGYPGTALGFPCTNVIVREQADKQPKVSIIIPSDNFDKIKSTVECLLEHTHYSNIEILIVSSSQNLSRSGSLQLRPFVKYVLDDRPFKFSERCNIGADASTGEYLVFYNDGVRVISSDWVKSLLDIATLEYIGAAGPKLLDENGLIQHAGMITGVRRFVGTAFHASPGENSEHFGMAQYTREVSLLSDAVLMVRTFVYRQIGGFDEQNTPDKHSVADLCFRIRSIGFACVYVPRANLKLIDLGEIWKDETNVKSDLFTRNKADIFLLKKWAHEVAYDPYFPPPMRDLLYRDSQEPFCVHPGERVVGNQSARSGRDILLVSHDLANSSDAKIILDLARLLQAEGHYICVLSRIDGPMRACLTAIGSDVIVDEVAFKYNESSFAFAKNFDLAIANTILTWAFVDQMGGSLPVYWYIHESNLIDYYCNNFPGFLASFRKAAAIWVSSGKSGRHLSHRGIEDFKIIPPGTYDVADRPSNPGNPLQHHANRPMVVGLFGSFEPREGQDLAVSGFLGLNAAERRRIELRLFGRVEDEVFGNIVKSRAEGEPSIIFGGELTAGAYAEEIAQVDVVLVLSRDDTLPLASIYALAGSKVLVVSRSVGISEWVHHGRSAIILEYNSTDEISLVLRSLCEERHQWIAIGASGRDCFVQNFSWESFVGRVLKQVNDFDLVNTFDNENI